MTFLKDFFHRFVSVILQNCGKLGKNLLKIFHKKPPKLDGLAIYREEIDLFLHRLAELHVRNIDV